MPGTVLFEKLIDPLLRGQALPAQAKTYSMSHGCDDWPLYAEPTEYHFLRYFDFMY